jgi:isopentenyl-diphosphate delta-isomerase
MTKVTDSTVTERRKDDHIEINLEKAVEFPRVTTGLERFRFMHQAVPELDLNGVSTQTVFFGKTLNSPLLISSMTGGTERAQNINRTLAEIAQEARIAMGLGSLRAAIEDPDLAATYNVRPVCRSSPAADYATGSTLPNVSRWEPISVGWRGRSSRPLPIRRTRCAA